MQCGGMLGMEPVKMIAALTRYFALPAFGLGLWGGVISTVTAHAVTYVYTDPQGSLLAEADVQGNITATFDYRPYGAQALGSASNGPGYTGHVNDADTGLTYMQQRYYDSSVGRFLSIDPVGVNPKSGDNFSRYWYANNNPYRFIDPDGRYTCGGDDKFCEKIDAYVNALRNSKEQLRSNPNAKSEYRLVSMALTHIGVKGEGGPNYVPGEISGIATAHTNQKGTTTVDTLKLDAQGDKASMAGAQAIAHEARHDMDVKRSGIKTSESVVRETERNAYNTSRAVDLGYGLKWTQEQYDDAVEKSVKLWLDNDSDK
jgi:RHS repeat-associated protein